LPDDPRVGCHAAAFWLGEAAIALIFSFLGFLASRLLLCWRLVLAAYLEATEKIDWRALHKRVVIAETPKPVNVEAHRVSAAPQLPEAVPSTSPFVLRRANLVRVNPERRSLAAAAPPSPRSRSV
jgi:hypothetical protein